MAHLSIFHSTFVKEPSVHIFIFIFLRGIWVMVGLKETECLQHQQDLERELIKA